MRNNYPWTTFLLIISIVLIFVVFFVGSLNPGNYDLGIIVFPWAFIQAFFQNKINFIFLILGFLQFPVYGVIIDKVKMKKLLLIVFIIVVHVVLCWSILNFGKQNLILETDHTAAYNIALPLTDKIS